MRKQLHVSGMKLLFNCGEAWRRRYLEGQRIAPNAALHTGSAVHKGIEINVGTKIETGELGDKDEIVEVARDYAVDRIDSEGITLEEGQTEDQAKAEVIDNTVNLTALHCDEVAPKLQPLSVERSFCIDMNGFPFDLAGQFDIEEADVMRDTKTARRKPPQRSVEDNIQTDAYYFAKQVLDGEYPHAFKFDYLVKGKTPKYHVLSTGRTEEEVQMFLRRYETACQIIENEVFVPAPTDHWMCNEKWCGYFADCPFARRTDRPSG